MRTVVATHGHCFDGLASAVLFTRLLTRMDGAARQFSYRGCGYGAGQQRPDPKLLDGDENAVLDYRFPDRAKLTWYFDHHRTAFASDADRARFDSESESGRFFYD